MPAPRDAVGCVFGCPQIEESPGDEQQVLAEVVEEGRFARGQHLARREESLTASWRRPRRTAARSGCLPLPSALQRPGRDVRRGSWRASSLTTPSGSSRSWRPWRRGRPIEASPRAVRERHRVNRESSPDPSQSVVIPSPPDKRSDDQHLLMSYPARGSGNHARGVGLQMDVRTPRSGTCGGLFCSRRIASVLTDAPLTPLAGPDPQRLRRALVRRHHLRTELRVGLAAPCGVPPKCGAQPRRRSEHEGALLTDALQESHRRQLQEIRASGRVGDPVVCLVGLDPEACFRVVQRPGEDCPLTVVDVGVELEGLRQGLVAPQRSLELRLPSRQARDAPGAPARRHRS